LIFCKSNSSGGFWGRFFVKVLGKTEDRRPETEVYLDRVDRSSVSGLPSFIQKNPNDTNIVRVLPYFKFNS